MFIPLPQPGARVGAYTLLEQLGQGGSGFVFKAERDGRLYAVKVLNTLKLGGWARRELTVLLRLVLDHVVQFRAFDRWPDAELGYPCIIMEYVPGLPLDAWARRDHPSSRAALTLFLKLARALREVYRLGVLHRDLKESNILVREADGEPVLIDFGFSAVRGALPETIPGMPPPGTPEYRSPEVMRFLKGETRELTYEYVLSDELWALGVTLYGLLTDELPFGERQEPGLNERVRLHSPPAPHVLNPRVPEAFSRLCLRMLEKDQAARFQDHDALCTALEELLAGAEEDASWDVPLRISKPPGAAVEDEPHASPREDAVREKVGGVPDEPPREEAPPADAPLSREADEASSPALSATPVLRKRPPLLLGVALSLLLFGVWWVGRGSWTATVHESGRPPDTSPRPRETAQAIPFREMASLGDLAQSDAGMAPRSAQPLAPSPIAMPSQPNTLQKSPKKPTAPSAKRKTTVGALALCAVTGGCAGGSAPVRPVPASTECPPGFAETQKQFDFHWESDAVLQGYHGDLSETPPLMREGPISVFIDDSSGWGNLPAGTVFMGRLIFAENRFFGRFTQVRTPDQQAYPVCVEIFRDVPANDCDQVGSGDCPREGSRPGAFAISTRLRVRPTKQFELEY